MFTYDTTQGDTWDLIAYKTLGDEKYMKYIVEANWPLIDTLVFRSGVRVTIPDLPEVVKENIPFWRRK